MEAKLTVLMPLFNQQEYISESIESVFAQKTNFNFRLIIIDDASTDNSLKIAESYQEKYPDRIIILKNESNLKLLRTIIKGYENTKTDYFCIIDPDDYWIDNNKLQKSVDFLENNPDFTIYATNTYVLSKDGSIKILNKIKKSKVDSDFNDYLNDKAVLGCSLGGVFRNVIFKNGVPAKLYEMADSKYSSAFRGDSYRNILHIKEGKVHYVNEPDAVYRQHPKGIWSNLTVFKQQLFSAKFYIGMYYYFDKIFPDFFLGKHIKSYDYYWQLVTDTIKTGANIEELKLDVNEILDLMSEVQKEYFDKKSENTKTTNSKNKLHYKIYSYLKKALRKRCTIK